MQLNLSLIFLASVFFYLPFLSLFWWANSIVFLSDTIYYCQPPATKSRAMNQKRSMWIGHLFCFLDMNGHLSQFNWLKWHWNLNFCACRGRLITCNFLAHSACANQVQTNNPINWLRRCARLREKNLKFKSSDKKVVTEEKKLGKAFQVVFINQNLTFGHFQIKIKGLARQSSQNTSLGAVTKLRNGSKATFFFIFIQICDM